jgi:hypothetical protein
MKRIACASSMAAIVLFLALITLLHGISSDIDPFANGISYYAFGEYNLILCLAFLSAGLGGILLGAGLWPGAVSRWGRAGICLLIAWGVCSIFAGIFPLDPPDSPGTVSGIIHNIAGRNVMLILPGVFLIQFSTLSPGLPLPAKIRGLAWAWLLLAAVILMFIYNTAFSGIGIGGLSQRFYWLVLCLWLLSTARSLFSQERKRT